MGPGFTAGADCHRVIETKRGHYLGRVIDSGSAIPNTGVPGNIGGYTVERIIRAAGDGRFVPLVDIGDTVEAGQTVAVSGSLPVKAQISELSVGSCRKGYMMTKGMKPETLKPDVKGIIVLPYQIRPELSAAESLRLSAVGSMEYRRKRCIPYKAM